MLRLNNAVVECLKTNQGRRFTARDLALWVRNQYPDECQLKLQRSQSLKSEADLVQQLVAEIGANRPAIERKFAHIRTTEDRPREYYWTEVSEEAEVAATEEIEFPSFDVAPIRLIETPPREIELYPKLAEFLATEFGLHSQRIDEKRSANKRGPQGNRWLYRTLLRLKTYRGIGQPRFATAYLRPVLKRLVCGLSK